MDLISKKSVMDLVMNAGMKRINNTPSFDLKKMFYDTTYNEERTMLVCIHSDGKPDEIIWKRGLGQKDGKLVYLDLPDAKYTAQLITSVSGWLHLVKQTKSFNQLVFLGKIKVKGSFFIRDYLNFKKFWGAYKDNIHLGAGEKLLLQPDKEDV